MGDVLPYQFYDRDTVTVAKDLLGKRLVRVYQDGSRAIRLAGTIVETEAYLGFRDKAAHSHKGMTPRNRVMFGPPGRSYVYFIYGMYFCFNIVTQKEGVPEAVLIRALEPETEPFENLVIMGALRGMKLTRENLNHKDLIRLCSGPGRLCKALAITRELNDVELYRPDSVITVVETQYKPVRITKATRIGVSYAGRDAQRLLRFYWKDHPHVSKAR